MPTLRLARRFLARLLLPPPPPSPLPPVRRSNFPFLERLPADVLQTIAASLDDPRDLCALGQCSHACRASAEAETAWLAQLDALGVTVCERLTEVPWSPTWPTAPDKPCCFLYEGRLPPNPAPPLPAKVLVRRARGAMLANERFYRFFREGDHDNMFQLWLNDPPHVNEPPRCKHPGNRMLYGHADVMASWCQILRMPPRIAPGGRCGWYIDARGECAGVRVHEWIHAGGANTMAGAPVGAPVGTVLAVNAFEMRAGAWRMTLHEAADERLLRTLTAGGVNPREFKFGP